MAEKKILLHDASITRKCDKNLVERNPPIRMEQLYVSHPNAGHHSLRNSVSRSIKYLEEPRTSQ